MSETFDAYREWLGIEPEEHPVDHYRLLGVPRFESDGAVIASAAEARMADIRRYQTGPRGKHTQELLNRLSTAKLCLLNPSTKAAYDRGIAAPAPPEATPASDLPPPCVPLGDASNAMTAPPPTAPPPLPPPLPPPAVGLDVPTPPIPAPPMAGVASAPFRDDGQDDDEADELSFFARPLFPLVVIGVVLLIAVSAWGIGRMLSERETLRESLIETAVEEPVSPESVPPEPIEARPEPADTSVVIQQEGDGSFNFSPAVAHRHGPHVQMLTEGDVQVIGNWKSPDDWIEWTFQVVRPAIFRVLVTYRTTSDGGDNRYTLVLNDGEVRRKCDVREAAAQGYVTDEHFLPVSSGGKHTLAVRADSIAGEELMVLRSIRLVPRTNP